MLKFSMQVFPKWVFLKGVKPSNFRPNMWLFKEIHYRPLRATPMKPHFNCARICAVLPQFRARGERAVRQDAAALGAKQTQGQSSERGRSSSGRSFRFSPRFEYSLANVMKRECNSLVWVKPRKSSSPRETCQPCSSSFAR